MRKLLFVFIGVIITAVGAFGQEPVKWSFSAKKIDSKTYEVHFTATVEQPWHIYSQTTPEGGPLPTKITFTKNPLLTFGDTLKEVGKMETKFEEVFEVNVNYFSNKVDFVQLVKVKGNPSASLRTKLAGSIEYMACTDEQCLPPQEVPFTVQLN